MSVYIKGMKMPKDGTYNIVHIYSDGRVSMPFWGKGMQIVQGVNAIPIPPHGRLVDADALDDAFTELRWDGEGLAHWGDRNEWCLSGNEVEELFNNAPTIIPAEDGGT